MTDSLPSSDYTGRISMLGSSNSEEVNGVYNPREFFIDTANWVVAVHDGQTPGGHKLARADMSNVAVGDIMSRITQIPVSKLALNTFKGTYVSIGGSDMLAGTNPQLAKASLANAVNVDATGTVICIDGSPLNLSSFSSKRVYCPNSIITVSNDVELSTGSTLVCQELVFTGSSKLTVGAGCLVHVAGTITGTNCIKGAGRIEYGNVSGGPISDTFTGDYQKIGHQLFMATDTVGTFGQGTILCDGGSENINDLNGCLVSQMKRYLATSGQSGVMTKTPSKTDGGKTLGNYFIYENGAPSFKRPLVTIGSGMPNYSRILRNGSMPTSRVTFAEDATVMVAAQGSDGSRCTCNIFNPFGAKVTDFIIWQRGAHGSGGFATIPLPKGWGISFTLQNVGYVNRCLVYGHTQSGVAYKAMTIY